MRNIKRGEASTRRRRPGRAVMPCRSRPGTSNSRSVLRRFRLVRGGRHAGFGRPEDWPDSPPAGWADSPTSDPTRYPAQGHSGSVSDSQVCVATVRGRRRTSLDGTGCSHNCPTRSPAHPAGTARHTWAADLGATTSDIEDVDRSIQPCNTCGHSLHCSSVAQW